MEPPKVSHFVMSPVLYPVVNQFLRCCEEPCVHLSGSTWPWVSLWMRSSPTASAASSASAICAGVIGFEQAGLGRVRGPHAGEAVGLQLGANGRALGARRVAAAGRACRADPARGGRTRGRSRSPARASRPSRRSGRAARRGSPGRCRRACRPGSRRGRRRCSPARSPSATDRSRSRSPRARSCARAARTRSSRSSARS